MGFTVGGPTAWKVVSRGEVAVAFHWYNGEPSMVLFPTKKRSILDVRQVVPYVLPLASAHELVKDGSGGEGIDGEVLLNKARTAVEVMGFGDDPFLARKVADLILDHIDDLCDMPPEPETLARRNAPTGELTVNVDGETVFQGEA